jgi:hypothetical protein
VAICETAMPCQADFLVALTRVWTHLQNSTPPVKWRWACWRATRPGIAGGRRTFAVGGWLRVAPGCAARKQAGFNMVRARKRIAIATVYGTNIRLPTWLFCRSAELCWYSGTNLPRFSAKTASTGHKCPTFFRTFCPSPLCFHRLFRIDLHF